MTIYDQTGKIVEKKFYHAEWKLTDLLKARNDGLITDEGEAWKYRYSHMDGTGGKYDLLFRRAAIEAPAQEPVAWRWRICYREEWCWSIIKPMFSTYDLEQGTVFDVQPLYTTPSDHLALVAAAYREVVRNILGVTIIVAPDGISHREGAESVRRQLAGFIETLTPADAEAHLTALLRAEYERGVRDTLAAADKEAKGKVHIGGQAFRTVKLDDLEPAALALLTQEGR